MSSAFIRVGAAPSKSATVDVVGEIGRLAGPLPQIALSYEAEHRLLWITLKPEPKPVFTLPVIESVARVQDALLGLWRHDPERPVMYLAYRAAGPVFSLGGDLDYYLDCLRANDRDGLRCYAEMASKVIASNRSGLEGTAITLANVHARAIGGGIDPARACNVMIAEEGSSFSYPEVNFNHFPISAVPVLSRHTGPIEAEKILLSGEEFSAAEFAAKGAVDAVVPAGSGEDWIRRYAQTTRSSHGARIKLMAAFNQQAGDLHGSLSAAARSWADHMMVLKPLEISRLQRIAAAQERMLGRLLRHGLPDLVPRPGLNLESLALAS